MFFRSLALAALALAGSGIVSAAPIIYPQNALHLISLDNPDQLGVPGTTVHFTGSIENTGRTLLFLNEVAWYPGFPPLAGIDLRGVGVTFIEPGQTLFNVKFFDVLIAPNAPTSKIFAGYVSVGANDQSTYPDQAFLISNALPFSFQVVNPSDPATTPEPATTALGGAGLIGFYFLARFRSRFD